MSFCVAIDGPSGAGKSTLAKMLAAHYGFCYIDTGAMYRAIGLYALQKKVDPHCHTDVCTLLQEIALELHTENGLQKIYLNGQDVSDEIRREQVGMAAAAVSSSPQVRAFLLQTQRDLARKSDVIMDGRDIGTVVLANADVKLFLTAAPQVRARRRYQELCEKGQQADYQTVLRDVCERDRQDETRETAPLRCADDAVKIDTGDISIQQAFEQLCSVIDQRREATACSI